MTLVFLGAWPQERQPCLLKAAARVRAEPFELILDHTELWRRPRIFCAAPANSPNALRQLVEQLNEYLPDCGFSPEKRPFAPHVSLVRKAMSAERRVLRQPICWQVKDFVLAQSSPGGPPPRYRVVDRWALREA
jgi:2'-5' RNA ligase